VDKSEIEKYKDLKLPTNLEICATQKKKFRLRNKQNTVNPFIDL